MTTDLHVAGRHYFLRLGALWCCACGEVRDRHGRPVTPSYVPPGGTSG